MKRILTGSQEVQLQRLADESDRRELHTETLVAYVRSGRPTGDCYRAVLSGNLFEAFARADLQVAARMKDLVRLLVNYAPGGCWGSPEHYKAWVEAGGYEGRDDAVDWQAVAAFSMTPAERTEAQQALVYEKALKLVRTIAKAGPGFAVEWMDQARQIAEEARVAWEVPRAGHR
jgi:hypothetical protein